MTFIFMRASAIALAFVNSLIVQQVLGSDALGLFAKTITASMFLAELFKLGVDQYAIKEILREKSRLILIIFLVTGTLLCSIILVINTEQYLVCLLSFAMLLNKLMYISNIAKGLGKWSLIIRDSLVQCLLFFVLLLQYIFYDTIHLNYSIVFVSLIVVLLCIYYAYLKEGDLKYYRFNYSEMLLNAIPQYLSNVSLALFSYLFVTKYDNELAVVGVFYILYRLVSLVNILYQLEISDKTKLIISRLNYKTNTSTIRNNIVNKNIRYFSIYLVLLPLISMVASLVYEFELIDYIYMFYPLVYFFVVALTGPINIYLSFFSQNKKTAIFSLLSSFSLIAMSNFEMSAHLFILLSTILLSLERWAKYLSQRKYNF